MIRVIRSRDIYIITTLLLLNFILKIAYLDFGCISGDEPFTIFYSQQDLADMLSLFKNENNPPLHFILLHFWIKLFGISPFATRFLSLIFSSITVVFIYKLGKKSFNIRVAIIASLIYTFSNYHIFFAHETRVYALFTLLTAVSMYAFLSLSMDIKSKKYFYLLVISNVLLIYSHFFGFFVLAIQALSILSIRDFRRNILKTYSVGLLITFLFYAPYLKIFLSRFFSSAGGTWVSTPRIESLYNILWDFSNAPVNIVIFLLIFLAALVLVLFNKNVNYDPSHSKAVVIWFLFPYLFIFCISFLIPMFIDRYLVFVSIGYYLTLAIAIDFLGRSKYIFYPLSILIIGMMIFTTDIKSGHDNSLKKIVTSIKQSKSVDEAIYLCPNWMNLGFAYHYNIEYFKDYKEINAKLNSENIYPIGSANEINDSILAQKSKIIYLDGWSKYVDPEGLIFKVFNDNYTNVSTDNSRESIVMHEFSK